jgi:glycosyltransferase involved in cell wall biosynthesis
MQSPFDLPFWWFCRIYNANFGLIIHDACKHPGDVYPRTYWMKRRSHQARFRIFLSNYVRINSYHNSSDYLWERYLKVQKVKRDSEGKYLLTLGRMRKYQGIFKINDIQKAIKENVDWIIAGKNSSKWIDEVDGIRLIDRWLDDLELGKLLKYAKLLILPYESASQSGLISLAADSGVPVVVTPVGGLPEQIISGQSGIIARGKEVSDIVLAIEKALETPFRGKTKSLTNSDKRIEVLYNYLLENR